MVTGVNISEESALSIFKAEDGGSKCNAHKENVWGSGGKIPLVLNLSTR